MGLGVSLSQAQTSARTRCTTPRPGTFASAEDPTRRRPTALMSAAPASRTRLEQVTPNALPPAVGCATLARQEATVTVQTPSGGVELHPVKSPTLLDAGAWSPTTGHISLSPKQFISLYDDVQWEEFVLEWATTLEYVQVVRNGGANDHGVDIAGFATGDGFDGPWDCYQCKHYARGLLPSDAYPEILKIALGTMDRHFSWPRRYCFVAPQGCGTSLTPIIHSPSKLKAEFRAALTKSKSPLAKVVGQRSLEEVLGFIDDADFAVFGTLEPHEVIERHACTRWHAARFGVALPARPTTPAPSAVPSAGEQRYIEELLVAYGERHGRVFTHSDAADSADVGSHYMRQRVAFYSAEALGRFARDSVPEGTFSTLQEQIFDGVVDVHDRAHVDGLTRLSEVTEAARNLQITSNGLLPLVEVRDRTGICHQLANDDRLTWCHADAQ
jgi:hypothetical protein